MADKTLNIRQNMLWNSIGSLTNLFCQWLVTVLVVRLSSGFDAAGQLSLAMAIANVFAPIAQFKIRAYQVSDVERKTTPGEYFSFRLATIAAALVVSLAYSLVTTDASALPVIGLYLVYKGIDALIDVFHGIDQQHMRMDYCGLSLGMRGLLSLAAFTAVLPLSNSLVWAVAAMCAVTAPVALMDYRNASRLDAIEPRLSLAKASELFVSCLPAVIGTACCTAVVTVSRQTLSTVYGAEALGIYASVCTPVVIVQAGANYIYSPLLGVFTDLFSRGDIKGYRSLLLRVTVSMLGLAVAGSLIFAFIGKPFLGTVFGETVASHSDLMSLAIFSVILCAYDSFLTDQLIAMRDMAGTLIGNGAALILVVILSRALIQVFGMNGTSLVITIAYIVSSTCMLAFLFRSAREKQAGTGE